MTGKKVSRVFSLVYAILFFGIATTIILSQLPQFKETAAFLWITAGVSILALICIFIFMKYKQKNN